MSKASANSKGHEEDLNFSLDAGPGCHIARRDIHSNDDWVIEWEKVNPEAFLPEEVFDIAVDPDEQTLSLCNVRSVHVVAYITVYDVVLRSRGGSILRQGHTVDNSGTEEVCTTLIVLCPPSTFVHLCYLEYDRKRPDKLRVDSDVQEWSRHSNPHDAHPLSLGFPLQGGPFRCTQGVGGKLTHFFSGNLHAIDFACPIGTPLLAVADGVVAEVKDENRLTGIAVSNLFLWNSILLKIDTVDPLFVEYVHIDKATVLAGDRVRKGQVIGLSGSIGFSPEPHLHFAAYRSQEATAATVGVSFESIEMPEKSFGPRAGKWYDAAGEVF